MAQFTLTRRIAYSGTNIDYAMLRDSVQPDDYDHVIHTDKDGGVITYKRVTQQVWHEDIICTKAEADLTIRSWITNRRTVVLTPDQDGDPGTTHNTQIMNATFPFAPWAEGKWRGTLILRKE